MDRFTQKTFHYFKEAGRDGTSRAWFEDNRNRYEEVVRQPFSILLQKLDARIGLEVPGIAISPRKITRPLRQAIRNPKKRNLVKDFSRAQMSERNLSRFEWNPCIYIQVGDLRTDNFIGLGCYMTSSRQMYLLRHKLDEMPEELDSILLNRRFKKTWGGLAGDRYVRFPRGFDESGRGAKYLWHRNFYVRQAFTKKEVMSADWFDHVVESFAVGVPFIQWLRDTVGTYSPPGRSAVGRSPGFLFK